ncbi:hypothetical protein IAR55_003271 [Kwoniella newhampshirensis]|uniref:UDP-glycosyltransferases domain-containing protein n=1 Tax=Kwoniella newhampshirensis TaxID=1651941 RepID=A0AAW0YZ13_9TREE
MTLVKPAHFVLIPHGMWGHLRPLLGLSLNLLVLHPHLRLTLLLTPSVLTRVQQELHALTLVQPASASGAAAQMEDVDGHEEKKHTVTVRIQLITCVSKDYELPKVFDPSAMVKEAVNYAATLPEYIKVLFGDFGGEDGMEGMVENKWKGLMPDFIIFDIFQPFVPDVIRNVMISIDRPMPPLVGFCPCNATSVYHHFAAEERGGFFTKMHRLGREEMAAGMDPSTAYDKHTFKSDGTVVSLPGLPAKFDFPLVETVPFPPGTMLAVIESYTCVHDKDVTALVLPANAELETEAVAALEKEIGKKVYMGGLQFTESVWNEEKPLRIAGNDDDERVLNFLDKMKNKHGSKSVCYISFGSMFFPVLRPDLVRYILNTLRESDLPFVFAYASGLAVIPGDIVSEFKDDENSCMVKFAPQWQVLNHDAIGFFVTHCGSNSVAEAIMTETPIVGMPFAADQGVFASLLTEVYKVGVTLKQVSTFARPDFNRFKDGTKITSTEESIKSEMRDTWALMKGRSGAKMRENMKGMQDIVRKSWKEGRAARDMDTLGRLTL